ncbi:MAG: hypothetical protein JSW65_07615 [Candidatus Bipolaricaulota bacterium]|nr:MAG: hypothetical protein JSW65_07615 [Candidatus Bipolaricaulota bacterium]
MLRKTAAGIWLVVLSLTTACLGGQTSLVAIRTPGSLIEEAEEVFRAELIEAMERAAESLGVILDTTDVVFLAHNDLLVVSAGAAGFEDAASSEPVLHADVGLIYLSQETEVRFGDGRVGSRLPAGFHAVKVAIDQTRNVHDPGVTILEMTSGGTAASVEIPTTMVDPSSERVLVVGLSLDPDGALVARLGWFGRSFGVELEVRRVPRS